MEINIHFSCCSGNKPRLASGKVSSVADYKKFLRVKCIQETTMQCCIQIVHYIFAQAFTAKEICCMKNCHYFDKVIMPISCDWGCKNQLCPNTVFFNLVLHFNLASITCTEFHEKCTEAYRMKLPEGINEYPTRGNLCRHD